MGISALQRESKDTALRCISRLRIMAERLSPEDRRQRLLDVAVQIVTELGVDAVRIPEVAKAAGVTRPVVYRFFPNRRALVMGILEDFVNDLEARFLHCLVMGPVGIESLTRALAEACCDAIEAKGVGAWTLLGMSAGDPELSQVSRAFHDRLIGPWLPRISAVTGASHNDVVAAVATIVASSRAGIGLYIDGVLERGEAVDTVLRAVGALLTTFTTQGQAIEDVWPSWLDRGVQTS